MQENLPDIIRTRCNEAVLRYLRGASAHSDIAQVLYEAVVSLPDARYHCANAPEYGFCVAARGAVVFAYARGMDLIGVRLSPEDFAASLTAGAQPVMPACDGWVEFRLFRANVKTPDVSHWLAAAHAAVPDAAGKDANRDA